VDSDQGQRSQAGVQPAVGVALVLGLMALMLGLGLLLRQAGGHPSRVVAPQTPEEQRIADAPASTAARMPTSTVVLAVAVPAATATPTAEASGPVATAVQQPIVSMAAADQTPRPLVIGTLQAPPRPAGIAAPLRTSAGAPEIADSPPAAVDAGNNPASALEETYTGLPVAVPATAVLQGVELPVGPSGVRSDGARAFAQTLLGRVRAQDSELVEDPVLRQVAEQALVDQLTVSTPTGRVVPTRVRRGSVTVQIDIVGTLPEITGVSLRVFPSASVPALGVAVGVAGRVEPDYLPDLVAVAAVAYR
jgi:hypothetical protein